MSNIKSAVIIGGGISGVSTAYELASSGVKPVLLEKSDLASMASGWTLGGVRQSGRNPAELPLARAAVERWTSLAAELGGDTHYRQHGNLRIARNETEAPRIQGVVETTSRAGIEISYLPNVSEVQAIAPAIAPTIHSASFCPSDGHADPVATVGAYAKAAEHNGARIRTGVTVESIEVSGGRVTGVQTSEGEISCDLVIVTAGVFTSRLLAPLDLEFPLSVRVVTALQSVAVRPFLDQVLGVASGNVATRQEVDGCLRLTGASQDWSPGLDSLLKSSDTVQPTPADLARVRDVAIEVLPIFDQLRIRRVWGGLIDQSPDALPVYSKAMGFEGLVVAAGFSGHGFCLGPVTGEIVADLATGRTSRFDLTPFSFGRFADLQADEPVELHG